MANSHFHRIGVDPGAKGVIPWIARWCDDITDLQLRELSIPCPIIETSKDLKNVRAYKAASQRNEAPLHSYLKFAASVWLQSGMKAKPKYEIRMYLPIEENLKGVTVTKGTFDPHKPRILKKGESGESSSYSLAFESLEQMFAPLGDIITVDVYCNNYSVEVGFTQPYNLCMPLFTGLVRKSIWIPYPKGISPPQFIPGSLKAVVAYELTCKDN